jgi:hypothetical protein
MSSSYCVFSGYMVITRLDCNPFSFLIPQKKYRPLQIRMWWYSSESFVHDRNLYKQILEFFIASRLVKTVSLMLHSEIF